MQRLTRRVAMTTSVFILFAMVFVSAVAAATHSYTVQAGDSLYAIARNHQTTIMELRVLNDIWTDHLDIGQKLVVPQDPAPTPRISYTEADLDLLARLVQAEAAGEPYLGQVAAAAVTINRVLDSRFPNTLHEVIYEQSGGIYQYEPVMNGSINRPAAETYRQAALEALYGADPTEGALGFYNPDNVRPGNWVRQWPVSSSIGNHVFFHL